MALGRRITGRLCYRIRLVVFSESAFVPLVCVTKPALGLEAMKVVRNSVASATTECPSSMAFIHCLFEGDAGLKIGESIPPCGDFSSVYSFVFFFKLTAPGPSMPPLPGGHATLDLDHI